MTVYSNFVKKQRTIKKNASEKVKNKENKFAFVLYILLGVILVLGLCYGMLANKAVTVGYNIENMERELNNIKDKNDELRIRISELQSVQVLEDKVSEIGMVEPVNIDYISIGREVALIK